MDSTMQAWRKKMPSKRAIASTLNQLVQQKSVAVLYTPTEVERIKQMTDMIREATSEFKVEEDWDRILKVVDALSNVSNRAVLKESIWYLKLRLGDPSCRVVILSLTLTESIVKNCGDLVHLEIATEHFMNEMEALYKAHANKRGRESMEISSRVLDMIQAWGEAFLPFRHELPLFVDTYHNMRKKGIKFPDQYDQTKVPVLTPSVDLREGVQNRALDRWSMLSNKSQNFSSIDTSSYSNSSSGLGGLSTPELHRVATNVLEMFEDMLFAAQTNSSLIDCHGIMVELSVEVREIMRRLEGAIPIAVVEEDKNLEKYLSLNDDVHAALKKYDVLLAGYQDANAIASLTSNASAKIDLINSFGSEDNAILQSDEEKQSSSDDDPFRDFVLTRTGPKGIVSTSAQELTKSEPETNDLFETPLQNEDPFASFVQQRATKIPNTRSNQKAEEESKLAATATSKASVKDLINLWDDVPALAPTTLNVTSIPSKGLWLGDDIISPSIEQSGAIFNEPPMQDSWNSMRRACSNDAHSLSNRCSLEDGITSFMSAVSLEPPFTNSRASASDKFVASNLSAKSHQPAESVVCKSYNPFDV